MAIRRARVLPSVAISIQTAERRNGSTPFATLSATAHVEDAAVAVEAEVQPVGPVIHRHHHARRNPAGARGAAEAERLGLHTRAALAADKVLRSRGVAMMAGIAAGRVGFGLRGRRRAGADRHHCHGQYSYCLHADSSVRVIASLPPRTAKARRPSTRSS